MCLEGKLLSLTLVNSPPTPCQAAGQTETTNIQYCVRLDHAVLLGQFTSHTGDRMYLEGKLLEYHDLILVGLLTCSKSKPCC